MAYTKDPTDEFDQFDPESQAGGNVAYPAPIQDWMAEQGTGPATGSFLAGDTDPSAPAPAPAPVPSAPAAPSNVGSANWIEFTNQLGGYTGPGGAFDASAGRTGASSAATAARGNLQGIVDQYNSKYGAQAKVVSGDRIDFGDGAGPVDVLRDAGGGQSGFWLGGGPGQGTGYTTPASTGASGGASGTAMPWTEGGGAQTSATPMAAPRPYDPSMNIAEPTAFTPAIPGADIRGPAAYDPIRAAAAIQNPQGVGAQEAGPDIAGPGTYQPYAAGADIQGPGAYQDFNAGPDIQGPEAFQAQTGSRLGATGSTPYSDVNTAGREAILRMLQQSGQPVDMGDPAIRAQSTAYANARNRALDRQRSAMAERSAFMGTNQGGQGGGSFDVGLNNLYERAGQDISANDAGLMGQEVAARRQQMVQAMSMANAVGAREEADQLQREITNLDQEYRFAGLNQQGLQNNQGMNLQAAQANQANRLGYAGLNQQGRQQNQELQFRTGQANQQNQYQYAGLNQQGLQNNQQLQFQTGQANQANRFNYAGLNQQSALENQRQQFLTGQANQQNEQYYAGLNQQGLTDTQRLQQQAALANQQNQYQYAGLNQAGQMGTMDQILRARLANQQNQYQYAALGQQGQQFGQTLGLDYARLGQQGSQFGQSLEQNQNQFNDTYGLDRARLQAQIDRDAMMAALGL
jgi:hypothetical protein